MPARIDELARRRLARECAKLDPEEEQRLAEEMLVAAPDLEEWPESFSP